MKTRKDKLLNMTVQRRVMKETMTEDGNKLGCANYFIKLSRHEIKFGIVRSMLVLPTVKRPSVARIWWSWKKKPSLIALAIEVKCPFALAEKSKTVKEFADTGALIQEFEKGVPPTPLKKLRATERNKVYRAISQIWTYTTINHLRYGVLTTFNQTWFLRRDEPTADDHGCSRLSVSPTYTVNRADSLPVLVPWLYMIHLLADDTAYRYSSPRTTPPLERRLPEPLDKAGPYQMANVHLGDVYFMSRSPIRPGQTAGIAEVKFAASQTVRQLKMWDSFHQPNARLFADVETEAYRRVEVARLPGTSFRITPRFFYRLLIAGFLHAVCMEKCQGRTLTDDDLRSETVRRAVLDAYAVLHKAGVIHGDVRPENLIFLKDDGRILIIDFEFAEFRQEETSHLEDDNKEILVKRLVPLDEWETVVMEEDLQVTAMLDQ